MPRLSPSTKAQRKAEAMLDLFERRGLAVGGVKIEENEHGYTITVLTRDAAAAELDPYEQWKRGDAA